MSKLINHKKAEQFTLLKTKKDETRINTYQNIFYSNIFNSPNFYDRRYERTERSKGKKIVNTPYYSNNTINQYYNESLTTRNNYKPGIMKLRPKEKIAKIKKLKREEVYNSLFHSNIFNSPLKDIPKLEKTPRSISKKQFSVRKNDDSFMIIRKKPSASTFKTGKKLLRDRNLTDTLCQRKKEEKIRVNTIQTQRKNTSQIVIDNRFNDYKVKKKQYKSDYSVDKYLKFENPHEKKMKELYNSMDFQSTCFRVIQNKRDKEQASYGFIPGKDYKHPFSSRKKSITLNEDKPITKFSGYSRYKPQKTIRQRILELTSNPSNKERINDHMNKNNKIIK